MRLLVLPFDIVQPVSDFEDLVDGIGDFGEGRADPVLHIEVGNQAVKEVVSSSPPMVLMTP